MSGQQAKIGGRARQPRGAVRGLIQFRRAPADAARRVRSCGGGLQRGHRVAVRSSAAACPAGPAKAGSRASCWPHTTATASFAVLHASRWSARLAACVEQAGSVCDRRDDAGRRRLPAAVRCGPAFLPHRDAHCGGVSGAAGARRWRQASPGSPRRRSAWKPRSIISTSMRSGGRNNPIVLARYRLESGRRIGERSSSRWRVLPSIRIDRRLRASPRRKVQLPIRAGASRCRTRSRARRSCSVRCWMSASARWARLPGSGSAKIVELNATAHRPRAFGMQRRAAVVVPHGQVAGKIHPTGRRARRSRAGVHERAPFGLSWNKQASDMTQATPAQSAKSLLEEYAAELTKTPAEASAAGRPAAGRRPRALSMAPTSR